MAESSERAGCISDFVPNIPCISIFSLPMCVVGSEESFSRSPVVCVCVRVCACACMCVCGGGRWWVSGWLGVQD